MSTIVIWAALVLLVPESFAVSITGKSGIPFSGQVVLFAAAFVIAETFSRYLMKRRALRSEMAISTAAEAEVNKAKVAMDFEISNLGAAEKSIIEKFIASDESVMWLAVRDVNVISLSQKNILICTHAARKVDWVSQMAYRINEKYLDAIKKYFNNPTSP